MVEPRRPVGEKPTEFPQFPALFTPEDVKRLDWIKEQRRKLSEVYQAKFTPEAQARMFPLERVAREFIPLTFLEPVVEAVTPWRWGWDFGMTPELFRAESDKLELEYKELARKQQVVNVLPLIQETLRNLALVGEDIGVKELGDTFKLDKWGFTEEEIGFVVRYAMNLMEATPEQLVSGEGLGIRPVSDEEMDYLRAALPPRHIQTVISLSQDVADITAALQEMYAPQVEDSFETSKGRIIKAYSEMLRSTGIEQEEGESLTEASKRAYEKMAEQVGEPLVLTDEQTGNMISASKRADGTVWFEGELLGHYDTEQQRVVPIDINTGKPLATEEAQESVIKDLVDSFYLGMTQAWYGTKQALFNVVPQAIASFFVPATEEQLIAEGIDPEMMRGVREGLGRLTTGIIETVQQRAEVRQAEYEEWLRERPELVPRPEYTQSPIEHPELFKDPYFYAYTVISNAPIIGAALLVGIATTIATKNPWAGAVAGAAVITPVQINSVYEDLIANGADPGNAAELATGVGVLMGAVEILPGMIVLKAASPVFMNIFRQNLQKEVTKQLTKRLIVKGVLTTATKIEVAETLEEVIQEAMQNAAVKTVNENRSIIENLPETAIIAAIATAPLAFFGGGASYMGMKAQLPQKVQDEIDTTTAKMEDAGLSPEHAEAVAFGKLVETEEGQAQVEIAAEKADEVAPVVEGEPSKIGDIETKLTTINSDIETFTSSIELQEGRLTKLTLPFERAELSATIEGLREQLSELEAKKTGIVKRLGNLKKPVVAPKPMITPELTREVERIRRISETEAFLLDEAEKERFIKELPIGKEFEFLDETTFKMIRAKIAGVTEDVEGETLIRVKPVVGEEFTVTPEYLREVFGQPRSTQIEKLIERTEFSIRVAKGEGIFKDLADPSLRAKFEVELQTLRELQAKPPAVEEPVTPEVSELIRLPGVQEGSSESILFNLGKNVVEGNPNRIIRQATELNTFVDEEGITRVRGEEKVKDIKRLTRENIEERRQLENEFYDSLNPSKRIGDTIIGAKGAEFRITQARFDVSQAIDVLIRTGFPSDFRFTGIDGVSISTGEKRLLSGSEVDSITDDLRGKISATLNRLLQAQRALPQVIPIEPVAPTVPTIDSIAEKLSKDYRLNIAETQFYNQNLEAIEQEVVRQRERAFARIREIAPEAVVTLGKLIPDLTYEPSQTLPRLSNLETEIKRMDDAIEAKPDIKTLIRPNRELEARKKQAEENLESLHRRLEEAKEVERAERVEAKKLIYEDFKRMAKDSGIGYKKLLASHWDDLTPSEQSKLILSLIDNHSLGMDWLHDFKDTAPVIASIEEKTGLPFYTVFERIKTSSGYAGRLQDEYFKRITNVPKWRKIVRDDKKMGQVALIIDSRRPGSTTEVAAPETEEEFLMVGVADEMLRVKKEWEPWIRFQRFIEAYEESSDIDSISRRILTRATEEERQVLNADLQEAKDILERNGGLGSDAGENAIWHFLADKTWGVIGSGYDSWRIYNPDLEVTEQYWAATRGAGYLMSRDTTQMPWNQQVGTLQRYDSYNLSMALRVLLTREIRHLAEFYNDSKSKWRNSEAVRKYLDDYIRAVQRYPERDADFLSRASTRMMQWAYPNVFWHPRMGYRNVLQVAWSFPYRDELVRSVWEKRKLPPSLKAIGAERFALVVDMSGKPLRNWMFQDIKVSLLGEETPALVKGIMGTLAKPLDFISAQTAKIPTIAITDKATRSASFWAMMVKGWRAVEQYKKDGDAKKWYKNSGVNSAYITRPQQAYILKLFALGEETISWAAPGLQEVTGYEAATIKIAEEITDRTLYLYDRSLGAQFHRVGMRALKSLATFPRSTIQMYGMQFERVFNKESTAGERTDALRIITMLWLSGQLLSAFLIITTGRRRGEYTLVNTITWSLGGLSFGLLVDIFDLLNDVFVAATGIDEDRAWAKQRVIRDLPRLTDVFVGFYSMIIDVIETTLDEPVGLDRRWLRDIKGLIEKDYTPGEVEKAERTVLEMVQKILFTTEAPDPDAFERSQSIAMTEEARLGEIDILGKIYTTKQFAGVIKRTIGSFADYLFVEEAGWSDLFLFYTYGYDSWREYVKLPTQPSRIRFEWRESHLEEEAMMLFWGEVSRSRFRIGTPDGEETMKLLRFWWDVYGITPDKRPKATWEDGGKIAGTE